MHFTQVSFDVLSGVVASCISGVFSLAQVFHVVRRRSVAGLSDVSWLLLALSFATWLSFGLLTGDPYQVATNFPSLLGSLWVVWQIHKQFPIKSSNLLLTGAFAGGSLLLQIVGGVPGSLAAVLAVTGFVRFRQQRQIRSAPDVTGVAMSPWVVSSVAQVFWITHGWLTGNAVLLVHAPFAILINVLLLVEVHRRRPKGFARVRPGGLH